MNDPVEAVASYARPQRAIGERDGANPVVCVRLGEFVLDQEEVPLALLADENGDAVLPAGGSLVIYGAGGAGKTTVVLDCVAHLASGEPWLGLRVPRPLRVLVIENEGPRPFFRQKLARKLTGWHGPSYAENVFMVSEPWARLTFGDETHQQGLIRLIVEHEIDLVVAGPVKRLGMVGGGTPDDVTRFMQLVDTVRLNPGRPVGFLLVHHENKSGGVSGAWDGEPDTLVHATASGKRETHLFFEKVRWASAWHRRALTLAWQPNEGFVVQDDDERDRHADVRATLEDAVSLAGTGKSEIVRKRLSAEDGERIAQAGGWMTKKEIATAAKLGEKPLPEILDDLIESGHAEYEKGPAGRHPSAECWRAVRCVEGLNAPDAPDEFPGEEGEVRRCVPRKGTHHADAPHLQVESCVRDQSAADETQLLDGLIEHYQERSEPQA